MGKRKIVWLELFADDREATAQFYADLFGFTMKDYPDMSYTTLETGNAESGIGIGQRSAENPGATMFYIESEDLAADLKAIESKGGSVVAPPTDIPGVGTMAVFSDPAGNMVALGKFVEQ